MVNKLNSFPPLRVDEALAIDYVQPARRPRLAALLALDATLGGIVRSTTTPLVGQMRLAWWREALARLDVAPAPGNEVLQALAKDVLPFGVNGSMLATAVDGWELLLAADPLDGPAMAAFATARGGKLFSMAAAVFGAAADGQLDRAGEGWALADLAGNLGDGEAAGIAAQLAAQRLETSFRQPWPRSIRALGALALLRQADIMTPPPAPLQRLGRVVWHRLSGR